VYGTLNYMSPEQVQGYGRIDHRSDLYSVGMTMYEMLTGRLPFDDGSSQYTVMRVIVEEELPKLSHYVPDLPEPLIEIVMKALAKDPAQRYQSAAEMRAALKAFRTDWGKERMREHAPAVREPASKRASATRTNNTWVWGGILGLLVAAVLTAGYFLWGEIATPPNGTSAENGTAPVNQIDVPSPINMLIDIRDRAVLSNRLDELTADGVFHSQSASDQLFPDSCYVFIIGPSTERVEAALGPDRGGRVDVITGGAVPGWRAQYAGYEKIWVMPPKRWPPTR
jgi:serine/threonine protein kinase